MPTQPFGQPRRGPLRPLLPLIMAAVVVPVCLSWGGLVEQVNHPAMIKTVRPLPHREGRALIVFHDRVAGEAIIVRRTAHGRPPRALRRVRCGPAAAARFTPDGREFLLTDRARPYLWGRWDGSSLTLTRLPAERVPAAARPLFRFDGYYYAQHGRRVYWWRRDRNDNWRRGSSAVKAQVRSGIVREHYAYGKRPGGSAVISFYQREAPRVIYRSRLPLLRPVVHRDDCGYWRSGKPHDGYLLKQRQNATLWSFYHLSHHRFLFADKRRFFFLDVRRQPPRIEEWRLRNHRFKRIAFHALPGSFIGSAPNMIIAESDRYADGLPGLAVGRFSPSKDRFEYTHHTRWENDPLGKMAVYAKSGHKPLILSIGPRRHGRFTLGPQSNLIRLTPETAANIAAALYPPKVTGAFRRRVPVPGPHGLVYEDAGTLPLCRRPHPAYRPPFFSVRSSKGELSWRDRTAHHRLSVPRLSASVDWERLRTVWRGRDHQGGGWTVARGTTGPVCLNFYTLVETDRWLLGVRSGKGFAKTDLLLWRHEGKPIQLKYNRNTAELLWRCRPLAFHKGTGVVWDPAGGKYGRIMSVQYREGKIHTRQVYQPAKALTPPLRPDRSPYIYLSGEQRFLRWPDGKTIPHRLPSGPVRCYHSAAVTAERGRFTVYTLSGMSCHVAKRQHTNGTPRLTLPYISAGNRLWRIRPDQAQGTGTMR